jgi:hypothetical protein
MRSTPNVIGWRRTLFDSRIRIFGAIALAMLAFAGVFPSELMAVATAKRSKTIPVSRREGIQSRGYTLPFWTSGFK